MANPIIERELIGTLRTRKAFVLQCAVAAGFALLVILRWPSGAHMDLSGTPALEVFRLFGYGLATAVLLIVPAFPAVSLVRERQQGTLALLLNSRMGPVSIYFGKLAGQLGFVLLLLMMTVPAAAACYAMGGVSLTGNLLALYGVVLLAAVQYASLALLVSTHARSADSALRITYGLVLGLGVVILLPHLFLQGQESMTAHLASRLRCLSPIPAVMQILGHGGIGTAGLFSETGTIFRYGQLALATTLGFMLCTTARLNHRLFDRTRSAGVMTEERGTAVRWLRRFVFLVDPQRRKRGIPPFVNPVMVKEFRTRRFGRLHWIMRLVALCAVISLGLTYLTTSGTLDWGVETIGGIMVLLQVALIVLLTPSLASGLISAERESGGWELLRMTPLSPGSVVRGKLMSVLWTMLLILCATLPGYLVMIYIQPATAPQVFRVATCLVATAFLAILVSTAVSSLFTRTAPATAAAYVVLLALFAGPMLFWLGRGILFGHPIVEAVLTINPLAATLTVMDVGGFGRYELLPANWWFVGATCAACLVLLGLQIRRLTRPL